MDGQYRITLDDALSFYSISRMGNSFLNKVDDSGVVILEIKYPRHLDDDIYTITRHFPVRMTKSSKYVTGMAQLYG